MKKKLAIALLTVATVVLTFGTSTAMVQAAETTIPNDATGIPDTNLYNAILEVADGQNGGTSDGILTAQEAESLIDLNADSKSIKDITGIEYCKNLTSLFLRDNQIDNINALQNLTQLGVLDMGSNKITDISPLSNLTGLTDLSLHNNQITDISAVKNLTSLTHLTLYNNQITDISAVKNLTELNSLDLQNNCIKDISALKELTNLNVLWIDGNDDITDIHVLENLTSLTMLFLGKTGITDISALKNLTQLTTLYLDETGITDLSVLPKLTNLTSLSINGNNISDLSPLATMTGLEYLYLSNNQITDVTPLAGLTSLKALYLRNNYITDISALEGLNLETLDTTGNPIGKNPWPFTDLEKNPGHWKYEAVRYVYFNDIMGGVGGSNEFQPDRTLTRAMFATVLYRMAGSPEVVFENNFSDVEAGLWYSDAIIWANQTGIVEGYSTGAYGINDDITREQIAKMLYLFAENDGWYVNGRADITSFTDDEAVSGWATEYIQWAVDAKMISGKPNGDDTFRIDPKGSATRAECAKMLQMFSKQYIIY